MGRVILAGGCVGMHLPLPSNFADATWTQIIYACQKNVVPRTWVAGNQKAMAINGAEYLIDIIGKNHDTYASGGTAPLTFQMHDCYETSYRMGSASSASAATNSGGWASCAMRSTHLPAILELMPDEVKAAIREVNKLTSAGSQSSDIVTTADKLFLLSEVEVFDSASNSVNGEGAQYDYYKAGNSKIKNRAGSANYWWERSPVASSSTRFCMVGVDGSSDDNASSSLRGVAFGFCF